MATGIVNWTATNGGLYEIWYGRLSDVGTSSLPPTAGWAQATGSPFDSSLGTATINGLDDNTQYRIDARADCTGLDSSWIDSIKYKLVCPSLSVVANPLGSGPGGSITATVTPTKVVEFSTIVDIVTLVIKNTSTSSVLETKVFNSPFSSPFTYTFDNLPVSTQYTVYLSIHDSIANSTVTCSNQSATVPTPSVTPPPPCTVPTFTLTTIQLSSVTINVTSTLATGDTIDVSLDGGITYPITGQTTTTIVVSQGIVPGTTYTVVLRRNCIAGGTSVSPSQTFTSSSNKVLGTISMNSNTNTVGSFLEGSLYLLFTFPVPTSFPLTLYFGFTNKESSCTLSNGYDIFTPPVGAQTCGILAANGKPGDPYYADGNPNSPFVVNIPQGVTTFNSGTTINTLMPSTKGHFWLNQAKYTDLYVKVNSPSSYFANFTISNGVNITGVVLHNV